MATPRQKSETEIKLEDVNTELCRLERVEDRFKRLLITILLKQNRKHIPDSLVKEAERYSKVCNYNYHKHHKSNGSL